MNYYIKKQSNNNRTFTACLKQNSMSRKCLKPGSRCQLAYGQLHMGIIQAMPLKPVSIGTPALPAVEITQKSPTLSKHSNGRIPENHLKHVIQYMPLWSAPVGSLNLIWHGPVDQT